MTLQRGLDPRQTLKKDSLGLVVSDPDELGMLTDQSPGSLAVMRLKQLCRTIRSLM